MAHPPFHNPSFREPNFWRKLVPGSDIKLPISVVTVSENQACPYSCTYFVGRLNFVFCLPALLAVPPTARFRVLRPWH
jgi:hypothetical protein